MPISAPRSLGIWMIVGLAATAVAGSEKLPGTANERDIYLSICIAKRSVMRRACDGPPMRPGTTSENRHVGQKLLKTLRTAGVMITTKSTGRKNRIIGTVSLGGSAAAFFSASFMRWSRLSCASVRNAVPSGVP